MYYMGIKYTPQTERNFEIYKLWKVHENLSKSQRDLISKKYDIGITRIYHIIHWCKNRLNQSST